MQFAQAMHGKHMSEMLGYDDYGAELLPPLGDNIPQHSFVDQGKHSFSTLKSLVNRCPKLYFIHSKLPIILYIDDQITRMGHIYASYNKKTTEPLQNSQLGFLAEPSVVPDQMVYR